jgi:hypothetical protein
VDGMFLGITSLNSASVSPMVPPNISQLIN